jgi:branched-chain amino acid transport system ATP-binding protein
VIPSRHQNTDRVFGTHSRRRFVSLTVIKHLTMLKNACAKGGWTVERVFGIFRGSRSALASSWRTIVWQRARHAGGRALMIDP